MGSLNSGDAQAYDIRPAMNDVGAVVDDLGQMTDAKSLLKIFLVTQFHVTKRIYGQMNQEQRDRFCEYTAIDHDDIEDW